ncbi:rhodanese-like domain-containing protein [Psychroflexus sp. CAK8W]|uniref:Rhodanese-like domain-containing protein n=1 Tax=Psychroflexus longus TaxID=2873596 RepID=A0ABS7XLF0_9FLAO|nr:rhodanese-like domain-containing protein [Psychroflexus longus]MBZ9779795.1 rhodanese-like domain-containing protein [Psychroflexus longus]
MTKALLLSLSFIILSLTSAYSQTELDTYLTNFTYESRKEMKISSKEIVQLLLEDKAILVDIRFEEEQLAWRMEYALKMPLPTLPQRYSELPKDKLIVASCPHKDRAIMAMMYLRSKGYQAAYLKDGLLGLAEHLRGDRANEFIKNLKN